MKINILATGSRGDIQPFIALGLEIKKYGHEVTITTFENYKDFIKNYNLGFHPIKGDVLKIATSELSKDSLKADNPLRFFLSFNKLKKYVYEAQKEYFESCKDADAIIFHPGAAIGHFIAKYYKIPGILATPFPMTETKEFPSLIFYDRLRLGKIYNIITHKILNGIMWMASASSVKKFWNEELKIKDEKIYNPFALHKAKELSTVISCSQHVFKRPDDWNDYVHMSGYWFINEDEKWIPPEELKNFINNGNPPIYIGFGSVGDSNGAEETTMTVIEAVKKSGQRAVLATGWNSMKKLSDLPENIFVIESAPHSWLFPKMAVVVHHGGAGTTAAALKAGIPAVIVPHGNDQFAWGRKIYELGVGSEPIPRTKLKSENLSDAIIFALKKEVQEKAKIIGNLIQKENGAQDSAKFILKTIENCKK